MPTVALTDLVKIATKDEVLDTLVGFLKLGEFPTTSWASGSVPRELVEKFALLGSNWSSLVSKIAKGGLLELAEGDWLTLYAASSYGLIRNDAVFAEGEIVFTDAGGAPITWAAGDLIAESTTGTRFVNTTGGTLNAAGTLTMSFRAESAGSAYNATDNTITTLATPVAGVTLTNAPIGSTGTWLTTSGTDEESDSALRERCRTQWGAIGSGGNADAYRYWARNASTQVTRVSVVENYPSAGKVTVFLAGSTGTVSASVVTAVNTYVQTRRPLTVTVYVYGASTIAVTLAGTVTYSSTVSLATVTAGVNAALLALQSAKGVGDDVYLSEIYEAIQGVPGVLHATLTAPIADFPCGLPEIPAIDGAALVYTAA